MKILWYYFYNLFFYPVAFLSASFLSLFQSKLRAGMLGRMRSINVLKKYFKTFDRKKKVFWFHAASLGEFNQLKTIIEEIKQQTNNSINIISFSSPSGMNNVEDEAIDLKFYLPFDFPWVVKKVLEIIQPSKLVFSSYDLWPNLLWYSHSKHIHTSIISAKMKKNSIKNMLIFKNFYQFLYGSISSIYAITNEDKVRFEKLIGSSSINRISVMGNPRYDTVHNLSKHFILKNSANVNSKSKYIIMGSAHSEDDSRFIPILVKLLKQIPELKILHVPHEPNQNNIDRVQTSYSELGYDSNTLSNFENITMLQERIIVVSKVGLLSHLYSLGYLAYIGGGFSTGIHNVMEPAIASLPVLFGPRYDDFDEAKQLIQLGGGFCIGNKAIFEDTIVKLIKNKAFYEESSAASKNVILNNIGSTKKVIDALIRE